MCGIHYHRKQLCDFKKELDIALGAKGIKGYEGKGDQDIEFDDQP